jgi:uncharacterized paraquat-inducible protein A
VSNSVPSEFTTTCSFCDAVSSVTLTGAHDELEVRCPRCGTYLGNVGALRRSGSKEAAAEGAAAAQSNGR